MNSKKANSSAVKALQGELKSLYDKPVEGFQLQDFDPSNIFEWSVIIFGPPKTIYEGGYFRANISFPSDYPYSPPTVKFTCPMFHPNIYLDGTVCISILHQPGDDPQMHELASERWNPTQTVSTIILSVISLLNDPNINSPANVDASKAYTEWRESKGLIREYEDRVKSLVQMSKKVAEKDGVTVPTTLDEYCCSRGDKDSSSKDDEYCFDEENDFYAFDIEDGEEEVLSESDQEEGYEECNELADDNKDHVATKVAANSPSSTSSKSVKQS